MDIRQKILGKVQYRDVPITREALDEKNRTIEMSFAAGANVVRWWGIEHLNMSTTAVRMDRWKNNPPFLMDHDRADQRGVILNGRLEDEVLRGTAKISRNPAGEELMRDIIDEIRTKTSVGYIIHNMRELKPEEMTPEQKEMALRESLPVFDIDDWEPVEGSSVAIAADQEVGVGRSEEKGDDNDLQKRIEAEVEKRMNKNNNPQGAKVTMPEPTPSPTPEELEKVRKEEILAISKRYVGRVANVDNLAKDAIELGITVDQFRGDVYSRVSDDKPVDPDSEIGLSDGEKKRYRFRNALIAALPEEARGQYQKDVHGKKIDLSFETDCSNAARQLYAESSRGVFTIPLDILAYQRPVTRSEILAARQMALQLGLPISTRDLTVGTATAGGNLVATNLLASSFIELLRNKTLALMLGVQEMFGLVGNVAIPKQTAATGGGWVTEGAAPTEGNLTVGQVTLAPKTYAAFSDYTRQLLLQATPSIDLVLQNDLARVQALAWDLAVFHGSGAAGQPQGIVGTSGVGSVTGTSLAWAGVLEFESDVAAANADIGSMAFVTTPSIRGTLKSRERATNTGLYLCDLNNTMAGYPLFASAQITAAHIIFGVFSTVLLGYWGGLDILVDPFTASSSGTVRTSSFMSGDVGVRHPGAFSVSTNFT